MNPNRQRPKVYDAFDEVRRMRETFTDRPVERTFKVGFDWPSSLQQIGDSLAVAYGSDKWQPKTASGRREVELYKHLAESRNVAFAKPGILVDRDDMGRPWPVIGPRVSLAELPMPKQFALLGWFEEICLKLYTKGTDKSPKFGSGDDGIVHVQIQHAYLAGSKVQWSRVDPRRENQPFLFVYTKTDGVMFLVFGEELDIEKDGIVG